MPEKTILKGERRKRAGGTDGSRFGMIKERHRKTYEAALSQGKVDPQMQALCSFIAGTKGYYTSSCCSGRIMLLERRGDRKSENFFHRKWHREVAAKELLEGINEEVEGDLWLKLDPFILHVGCAGLADANTALAAMKKAGVKRGGIMLAENGKFLIELQGTGQMAVPVKLGAQRAIEDAQALAMLPEANRLLSANYRRLKRLEAEFRKSLK